MDLDVVVLGSGLTESIAAAALSKAGYKVAHLDVNPYYGGGNASLTTEELVAWADERASDASSSSYVSAQRSKFTSISRSALSLPQSRQYSISLSPAIIPSIGPLIDALIASGVSRYGGFKLLEKVAIYIGPGSVKPVPGSKEDVFKSKDLSLLDKRRLMRFLMFAAGDFEGKKELEGKGDSPFTEFLRDVFSLEGETAAAIAYALAFCVSAQDPTLPSLQRIRKYLRSTGRYGPSSFLVGHYGGLGEIAQGFCRTAAVGGAAYILSHNISLVEPATQDQEERKYRVSLEGLDESLSCDLIISSSGYPSPESQSPAANTSANNATTSNYAIARAIAIIDRPLSFSTSGAPADSAIDPSAAEEVDVEEEQAPHKQELDTALLVFPPSSLPGGSSQAAANLLVTGEGSMSTPRGKWILYLSLTLLEQTSESAEGLMRPYLDATLGLAVPDPASPTPAQSLFTLFYIEQPEPSESVPSASDVSSSVLKPLPSSTLISEQADSAAINAEALFWKAVEALKAVGLRPKRRTDDGDDVEEEEVEVEGFWPPLDMLDDPSDDW